MTYALESIEEAQRLRDQQNISAYCLEDEFCDFHIEPNAKVLDAGCGEGAVSRFLLNKFSSISLEGVDFSDIRVAQAKQMCQSVRANFSQGNLEGLSIEANTYDAIVSRYVFEHLPDPQSAAHELFRVAKSGACVRICDLDNLFTGFYSTDFEFNKVIRSIETKVGVDLNVGRKIPAMLVHAGFEITSVKASAHYFSDKDLEMEKENYRKRFSQMSSVLNQALGSEEKAQWFTNRYIELMGERGSVYFMNKFVVDAIKP